MARTLAKKLKTLFHYFVLFLFICGAFWFIFVRTYSIKFIITSTKMNQTYYLLYEKTVEPHQLSSSVNLSSISLEPSSSGCLYIETDEYRVSSYNDWSAYTNECYYFLRANGSYLIQVSSSSLSIDGLFLSIDSIGSLGFINDSTLASLFQVDSFDVYFSAIVSK